MRIRIKLTTVQLIMAVALFLSLITISIHLNNFIKSKDTVVNIEVLDSQISHFGITTNSLLNQRAPVSFLGNNIESRFLEHMESIDQIVDSGFYNSGSYKDLLNELIRLNSEISASALKSLVKDLRFQVSAEVDRSVIESGIRESLNIYPEDEVLNNIVNDHKILKEKYNLYFQYWEDNKTTLLDRLVEADRSSLVRTIISLLVVILLTVFINNAITNKISKNIAEVTTSLERMTAGDFTSTLHIEAGDEFGDLARSFNIFIQQMWKKLDSMNVIMGDIGQAMNQDLDLSKIQINILNNITNNITSDASAIFLLKDGSLHLSAHKGNFPPFYPVDEDISNDRPKASRYYESNSIPLDIEIVRECFDTQRPIIVKHCPNDDRFPQCRDEKSALFINSFMMVPLISGHEVMGIMVVTRSKNRKQFSDMDFSNFSSFSDYTALTIDTLSKYNDLLEKFEMQKEIGVAADIQKSLVPGKMPKIKGITSSAYTLAAKGVSGDYYDFFRMNQNTIGATVCDVAGKGVPASLVMVMIRTILRLVASPSRSAAETLTMLNRAISGKIDVDRYATMSFFKIDLKEMKLHYTNAAHHPIQIFRQRTNQFYAVDSPGLPIGIDRDAKFNEKRISLEPGDIIFMYTDGFPEARNHEGDEYSTSRMLREIRIHSSHSANEILNGVVTDMQNFTSRANQHDDQTILIIKIDEEK